MAAAKESMALSPAPSMNESYGFGLQISNIAVFGSISVAISCCFLFEALKFDPNYQDYIIDFVTNLIIYTLSWFET